MRLHGQKTSEKVVWNVTAVLACLSHASLRYVVKFERNRDRGGKKERVSCSSIRLLDLHHREIMEKRQGRAEKK